MSLEAVKDALPKLPYDITEVDLIVSASYSPYDTVATARIRFNMSILSLRESFISILGLFFFLERLGGCGGIFRHGEGFQGFGAFR